MGEFAKQNKALNYPELTNVNPTDTWDESCCSYPGRSDIKESYPRLSGQSKSCGNASLSCQKSAEVIVPKPGEGLNVKRFTYDEHSRTAKKAERRRKKGELPN